MSARPEFEPAISPTGDRLAFSRLSGGNYDVYVMDLDDRRTQRLTSSPTVDEDPSWSPEGDRLVYTSERRSGDLQISVVPASGGASRTLAGPSRRRADMEADWRRDAAAGLAPAVAADHGVGGFPCGAIASTGTSGVFRLVNGTDGKDRLCGGPKRDWLRGYGGRDHLAGGSNKDRFEGGAGGDWFYAKDGEHDELWGGTRSGVDHSTLDWAHRDKGLDDR